MLTHIFNCIFSLAKFTLPAVCLIAAKAVSPWARAFNGSFLRHFFMKKPWTGLSTADTIRNSHFAQHFFTLPFQDMYRDILSSSSISHFKCITVLRSVWKFGTLSPTSSSKSSIGFRLSTTCTCLFTFLTREMYIWLLNFTASLPQQFTMVQVYFPLSSRWVETSTEHLHFNVNWIVFEYLSFFLT